MGSEVASQSIIDGLRHAGFNVHTVGYLRTGDFSPLPPDTTIAGVRYIESRQAKFYPLLWLTMSMLKQLPYTAAKYYSRTYVHHVKRLLSATRYNAVIIDHPQMAWIDRLVPSDTNLAFVAHNVEHEMYAELSRVDESAFGRTIYRREARRIQEMESRLTQRAMEIWALTESDANYFRTATQAKVRVVPLPATSSVVEGPSSSKQFDIGLIGNWAWQANKEGLQWFIDKVLPYLPTEISIQIAGKGADNLVPSLRNVKCTGFVPDAIAFMQQARVVAIPTLSGGGIQIKTLDAIGSGSFIVATQKAMRGIAKPPATVMTANEPREFAQKLSDAWERTDTDTAFSEALAWSTARRQLFQDEMTQIAKALV